MLRPVLLLGLLLLAPDLAAAADEHLATPKLAKAAVACQKVIAQVGAKVLAGKLKALDTCANAALACVETKHDKPDCLAKAGATCGKQLEKAAQALAKSEAKITGAKSCATELRLPDLLSADGLGLGDLAGDCQTDFGKDISPDSGRTSRRRALPSRAPSLRALRAHHASSSAASASS